MELEAIARQQAIDSPATGPLTATAAQKAWLEKAIEDAVAQEDRLEQIVRTTRSPPAGSSPSRVSTSAGNPIA